MYRTFYHDIIILWIMDQNVIYMNMWCISRLWVATDLAATTTSSLNPALFHMRAVSPERFCSLAATRRSDPPRRNHRASAGVRTIDAERMAA